MSQDLRAPDSTSVRHGIVSQDLRSPDSSSVRAVALTASSNRAGAASAAGDRYTYGDAAIGALMALLLAAGIGVVVLRPSGALGRRVHP